ncbi:MAG: DUF998 domain-containing protein, partial [Mycobacterium sp.]
TTGAQLHWVAAMAAFAGLPIAPLCLARRHRIRLGCSWLPRLAGWLGAAATFSFGALLGGSLLRFSGQPNVWPVGGVLERALAGSEIVAALILAVWLLRGCRCGQAAGSTDYCDRFADLPNGHAQVKTAARESGKGHASVPEHAPSY